MIAINKVSRQVETIEKAVGCHDGAVAFSSGHDSESRISLIANNDEYTVQCVRLDTIFANDHLDILKIDTEGLEEKVLEGCHSLLKDKQRCPRCILIELHQYAWQKTKTNSTSILNKLRWYTSTAIDLKGNPIDNIDTSWLCWLIAKKD